MGDSPSSSRASPTWPPMSTSPSPSGPRFLTERQLDDRSETSSQRSRSFTPFGRSVIDRRGLIIGTTRSSSELPATRLTPSPLQALSLQAQVSGSCPLSPDLLLRGGSLCFLEPVGRVFTPPLWMAAQPFRGGGGERRRLVAASRRSRGVGDLVARRRHRWRSTPWSPGRKGPENSRSGSLVGERVVWWRWCLPVWRISGRRPQRPWSLPGLRRLRGTVTVSGGVVA